MLSWGQIDSLDGYYGFIIFNDDKPGQSQAGILDSYFIRGVYFITTHAHTHTIHSNPSVYNPVFFGHTIGGWLCLNNLLVFRELFALYHICLSVLFYMQKHWWVCSWFCSRKLSEPISYLGCMRTPAGHLLALFSFFSHLLKKHRVSLRGLIGIWIHPHFIRMCVYQIWADMRVCCCWVSNTHSTQETCWCQFFFY